MKRALYSLSMLFLLILMTPGVLSQTQYAEQSVLSSGEWYKISVPEEGIYKIDYAFLTGLGIDAATLQSKQVHVFGNRGGMLPQRVDDPRTDDLAEIATYRSGLDDGAFDQSDYLLFYAEGPSVTLVGEDGTLTRPMNIYDTDNHYFIALTGAAALTPQERPSLDNTEFTVENYQHYARLEEDQVNLLGQFLPPGSGKRWFGDEFSAVRERTYAINLPGVDTEQPVRFRIQFAGRSSISGNVKATIQGQEFNGYIARTDLGDVEDPYARIATMSGVFTAVPGEQLINVNYPVIPGASNTGWLDFIEMQGTCALSITDQPFVFNLAQTEGSTEVVLQNGTSSLVIWDLGVPHRPVNQLYASEGTTLRFGVELSGPARFVAFDPGENFERPSFVAKVDNQNVHGVNRADLVIIYHPDFEDAAMMLGQHRVDHNGYEVAVISVEQIYNEFSGGSVDPTAIRDFAAMLYRRDANFRYMLFVGDATYDYRHFDTDKDDDNFIPAYETDESMDPIRSFPSDDYFALLDDHEGESLLGAIDIAVGRLPVGSTQEAAAVVDKIINYDIDPATMQDWRLRLAWVADDEDNNLHLNQSEDISTTLEDNFGLFNLDRIYLDAFQQVSTPGGARYPDVNAAINNHMFKGILAINYLGHGGHLGWAQERILQIPDIQSWTNYDRLPIFVTATCSFTGYDEPSYQSAGEQVLLNPNGGAVALLTTVRAVYSSSNKRLTSEVFDRLVKKYDGEYLPIGDVMRLAKNSNSQDTIDINARKFAIIGDPSMKLAIPTHDILLTELNGEPVGTDIDTIGALEKVTLRGEVRHRDGGKLDNFSGKLYITVYDKPQVIRTLANDSRSFEREFENLSKVIFKGSATVTQGEFTSSFVVPQDIDFSYGRGKISLYATDEIQTDAAGSFSDFIIGGTGDQEEPDTEGPEVSVFMNNESFERGGETGPNPTLLVKLFDESGINVIGNSIGHDLVAVLDGDSRQSYVLNTFYEADIDDFRSGVVRFPLSDLEPGPHTIKVTAWDVANNFAEASTDFVVVEGQKRAIRNVRSYPNPLNATNGDLITFEFEHDLGTANIDAYIDIYDINGRLIRSVEKKNVVSVNGFVSGVQWNGSTQGGNMAGAGVYVYRIRLRTGSENGNIRTFRSPFEKLILIN